MTPAEEESYVRERWVDSAFGIKIYCSIAGRPSSWLPFNSWHAAYLFTKQREAEIVDLKEEELVLRDRFAYLANWKQPEDAKIYARILAREQAALVGLRRGWKDQG